MLAVSGERLERCEIADCCFEMRTRRRRREDGREVEAALDECERV
jgi:hypothetical protein